MSIACNPEGAGHSVHIDRPEDTGLNGASGGAVRPVWQAGLAVAGRRREILRILHFVGRPVTSVDRMETLLRTRRP